MSQVNLNLLPYFIAVAEDGSFTAAAKRLGSPRSVVSRGVASLEGELGVQLFLRTTRTVSLTSAGEALYGEVAATLDRLLQSLERLPEREDGPSGTLRITTPYDIGSSILPRALVELRQRHADLRIDVRLTNRVVDLIGEGFDAAIRPGPATLPDSSLRARRLTTAGGGIYASPTYLARAGRPTAPQEALAHDWVGGPVNVFDPSTPAALIGDDMLFVRSALLGHAGLGFLPSFLVQEDLVAGRLVTVDAGLSTPRFNLYFLTPPAKHVPQKVRALRDHLLAYFALHPLP